MIAAAAVLAGAVTLAAPAARAHAFLDHASPAVGSSLPAAPSAVTMWFTQQLEPAFTTATVSDKSGARVDAVAASQAAPETSASARLAQQSRANLRRRDGAAAGSIPAWRKAGAATRQRKAHAPASAIVDAS